MMNARCSFALLWLVGSTAVAADTPAAEFTRGKRLPARITVAVKDRTLKAALEEIADAVETAKLGRVRFDITTAAATKAPASVSIDAKDATLVTVLRNLLGPHGLKAEVVSAENDKADGWLRITLGEVTTPMADAPAATAEEEKDARQKLDAAKKALAEGKAKDAKFLLEYVLKKYPTATAAVEAKTTLETLKP